MGEVIKTPPCNKNQCWARNHVGQNSVSKECQVEGFFYKIFDDLKYYPKLAKALFEIVKKENRKND